MLAAALFAAAGASTYATTAKHPRTSAAAYSQVASDAWTTIQLPGHPFSIVPTRDGRWLFISVSSTTPAANGVAVLKRTAGYFAVERVYPIPAVKNRPPQRPGPSGMVMTHDERLLIAANDSDILVLDVPRLIAGDGDPVVGRLTDGESAGSIYVNVTHDDKLLFISDEHAQTISVVDLQGARKRRFEGTVHVGKIPAGIASIALTFSPDERWLFTTSEVAPETWRWPIACPPDRPDRVKYSKIEIPEGAVMVVDVRRAATDPAHAVAAKVQAGCSPVRLAVTPDGKSVWVSARRADSVLGFETAKLLGDTGHARIGSVAVGTAPVGIAALPDGVHIVVANSNRIAADPNSDQTLSVIDIRKVRAGEPAVVGTIAAGAFPREFTVTSDRRTLYLGNFLSNTVQAIDLTKLSSMLR